ncbi:MAG: AAA family ATPase [Roseovarius sp.]
MSEHEMDVIAVVNGKGGVGKTTLARALGSAVVGGGMRVAFIDSDPQLSVVEWAERSKEAGLWSPAASVVAVESPAEMAQQINDLYEREAADVVIIDTAGVTFSALGSVVAASDHIVMPCTPNVDDVTRTLKTAEMLRELGQDGAHITFVLNRVGSNLTRIEEEQIARLEQHHAVAPVRMRERDIYKRMAKEGLLSSVLKQKVDEGTIRSLAEARRVREALMETVELLNIVMGLEE